MDGRGAALTTDARPALSIEGRGPRSTAFAVRASAREQTQQREFFDGVFGLAALDASRAARSELFDGLAARVCLDDGRVDVAVAADRRRVAQAFGDAAHRGGDVFLRQPLVVAATNLGEFRRGQKRPAPRAEVFGGELRRGRRLDVVVHVAREDCAHAPVLSVVLEEFGAADGLDVAHERGEFFVNEYEPLADVVLARELEDEATAALDFEVAVAERRHAVSAVTADARLRADAEVEVVDESDDDRQHALSTEVVARDVLVRPAPERGQGFAEALDLLVLPSRAQRDERRVVDALHAPGAVNARGLKSASRRGRDSNVAPSGRDDERLDAFERGLVCDALARSGLVAEAARLRAAPAPPVR